MTPQEYLLERSGVVDAKTRAAIREACTAWDEERIALVEALASVPKRLRELEARLAEAEDVMRPLVTMLDALMAESGKGYDWGEEDAFRMGEWFEKEDITALERAITFLEAAKFPAAKSPASSAE